MTFEHRHQSNYIFYLFKHGGVKSGPQIAAKVGNPAGLLCRRIWYSVGKSGCVRDNGIPPRSTPAKIQLIQCIDEIRAWMLLHQLKLNDDKTEFMVLQSSHNLRVHGSPTLQLPQLTLTSTDTARNLGCFLDRHMQLDRLVSSYCSSAYYHLANDQKHSPSSHTGRVSRCGAKSCP